MLLKFNISHIMLILTNIKEREHGESQSAGIASKAKGYSKTENMGNHRAPVLLPKQKDILKQMGYQIRMVRQRRKLSVNLIAERAGVSRQSVWAVEKGSPSVVMGTYLKVLHAVGFDKDLLKVCADDPLGKFLQDQRDDKYKREEEVENRW